MEEAGTQTKLTQVQSLSTEKQTCWKFPIGVVERTKGGAMRDDVESRKCPDS